MSRDSEDGRAPFGEILREFRLAAGLSQEILAERARMSAGGISALERGARRIPHRDTLRLLATALELSATDRASLEDAARAPARPRRRRPPGGAEAPQDLHNAPPALTSLIGRETEIGDIVALVRQHRLVTLTGAGGVGKTRAALEVCARLHADVPGGVWFVELAPVADDSLVPSAIAMTLGAPESPDHPQRETLVAYLKNKAILLVLDNCEHVVAAVASTVDALLRSCPQLRILATSREPLKTAGERRFRVPSLPTPPREAVRRLRAGDAIAYGAIALFDERARAVDHRFAVTDANAPAVGEICRRLDGIPLAIELAAARVTLVSPSELLKNLDQRLTLLAGGDRGAPPRLKTMRALIDWSYDLLSDPERIVFDGLSSFAGGCTLDAARRMVTDEPNAIDALDLLSSLVDKSLVTVDFDRRIPRYRLLETFQEYAREKLESHGRQAVVAQRHGRIYLELAVRLEQTIGGARGPEAFSDAKDELENFRAALEWALGERGDVSLGQRLAGALRPIWTNVASAEGRRWVRAAIDLVGHETPAEIVAQLYSTESDVALRLGELTVAVHSGEQALLAYRKVHDAAGTARVQYIVGLALSRLGRTAEGEARLREALEIARTLENRMLVGEVLKGVAHARSVEGDVAGARRYYAEALDIFAGLGAERSAASVGINLAEAEFRAGNAKTAVLLGRDALASARHLNQVQWIAGILHNLAAYHVALGDYDGARAYAGEALDLAGELQIDAVVAWALQHLAAVAALRPHAAAEHELRDRMTSARLLGFVTARFAALGTPQEFTEQQEYDRALQALRRAIDAAALGAMMAEGAAMSEDQAFDEARRIVS